jgi:hypothetical protein
MLSHLEGKATLMLVVVELYLILLCSLVETDMVLQLFAIQSVDVTISISLILTFAGVSTATATMLFTYRDKRLTCHKVPAFPTDSVHPLVAISPI